MRVTRAGFLSMVATGFGALALTSSDLLAGVTDASASAAFKDQVGSVFRVSTSGRGVLGVELVLQDVVAIPSKGLDQFTLVLASMDGFNLREGMYDVTTRDLGSMRMYLKPVGAFSGAKNATLFHAPFSLLLR